VTATVTPIHTTSPRSAVAAVIVAAALFGTAGPVATLLVPDAWPPAVAAVRLVIGASGLVALVYYRGQGAAWRALLRSRVLWLMGGAVAGYQVAFFIAVNQASVSVAALVAIGSAPLFAGALAWLIGDGSPGWAWAVATAIGLGGLALLTGTGGSQRVAVLGIVAALLAGLSYAIYTVVGVRLSLRGGDPIVILAAAFAIGAVLVSPALVAAREWLFTFAGLAMAGWGGIMSTTLAYAVFALALPVLRPGTIATLTLAEPLTATLLGVLVLNESLAGNQWLGGGLLLAALLVIALFTSPRATQQPH